jgi:hypothetical protein
MNEAHSWSLLHFPSFSSRNVSGGRPSCVTYTCLMGCCHWTMAIQLLEQMPQQRMETDLVAWTRGDDMWAMLYVLCICHDRSWYIWNNVVVCREHQGTKESYESYVYAPRRNGLGNRAVVLKTHGLGEWVEWLNMARPTKLGGPAPVNLQLVDLKGVERVAKKWERERVTIRL